MKRISLLAIVLTLSIFAKAQITGTKTIPSANYPTLKVAIDSLNLYGVGAGGVTINLTQAETAPTGGYLLGSATLNASTGITKPIVINGGNFTITAQSTGTSTFSDAVIRVAGPDYVTLNQIRIVENPANLTSTTQMERGIAIMGFSATDGSQNVTIQNCNISLGGTTQENVQETGVLVTNMLYTSATTYSTLVVPTATTGKFDSIVIKANTINNCYIGIAANAGSVAATAANLQQTSFIVGGTSAADANTITNYGSMTSGTTTFGYGVYTNALTNPYISYNNLSTIGLQGIVNHIHVIGCLGNEVVSNNKIDFTTAVASTSTQQGIYIQSFSATLTASARCDSNTVQNVTLGGTNIFTGIFYNIIGLAAPGPFLHCRNNTIKNITRTGLGGNITGINFTSANITNTATRTLSNNVVSKITATANTAAITFNGLQWAGTSGIIKGNRVDSIDLASTVASTVNLINSTVTPAGLTLPHLVDSNKVSSVKLTGIGFTAYGVLINIPATASVDQTFSRNSIDSIAIIGGGTTAVLEGISVNTNLGTGLVYITNNAISRLSATAANTDNAIKGINVISGDATKNLIYNNTIYPGGGSTLTSTGTNFGVSGICFNVGVTIKNNIINVSATPTGNGRVSAIRSLLAGTSGVISANFGANSSNNVLYAINGTNSFLYSESAVGVAPVVFYNLTNDPAFNSSCSIFKTLAGTRGASTFAGNNLSLVTAGVYAPTGTSLAESNATVLASVTTDIYGTTRPSTPDCGAVEFAGTTADFTPPSITYTNIPNSTYCTTLPTISAIITDGSGINTTAGTKPRIYYKKSTENDAIVGNTSANNGWKFVEASNSSSPFTFTLNNSLLTSTSVAGDIIQYFVVAQDLAPTPNIASQQVSYASGYCPASVDIQAGAFPVLSVPVINSFTVLAPNVTLSATATPAIICINGSSTLSSVDTTTLLGLIPTGYTGPFVTGAADHEISRIQIVGTSLNNSSTCATTGGVASNGLPASILGRYSNYTSTVTPVTLTDGTTYTVNLDGTVCGTGSGFQMGLSCFIDLNRNGVFDMPAERVYANTAYDAVAVTPAVTTKTFTFTIPSTGVVNGPTLMRFYMNGYAIGNTHTPSTTGNFGEVEDYQIYLNTSFAPTLNAIPSTSFTWSPSANIATNPNKTVFVSSVVANTNYTVTTTDAGGCTYTKTTTVTLAPSVTATGATGTKLYCASTPSTTLTATTQDGVAPYTAVWSGGSVVSTSGLSATLNPPVGITTYNILVTDACGTTSSTTVDVEVLPNPTAIVTPGNSDVCFGAFKTQSASGSSPTSVYTWMPGALTGPVQALTSNTTTVFTITATDGMCSSTATFTHTIKALPTVTSTTAVPSTLVCAGDSVQLNVIAISGINEYQVLSTPYSPVTTAAATNVLCDSGIVKTAQSISGLDNGVWNSVPIGFTFDYFGSNYTTFHVSTNGFISLGTPLTTAGCCNGQSIPVNTAPNGVLALAWTDLNLSASGKIDYFLQGTTPNRKLVVRYTNVPRVGGASGPLTGQVILHESTGLIEYHIASMNVAAGDLTTMGIENTAGTVANIIAGRDASAPWTATNEGWLIQKSPITSYNWVNNSYINNTVIANPKVAPNFTTTYTVTVSNAYGCTKTSTTTANVRNLVSGVLTPTADTICWGESSTIAGNVAVVCTGTSAGFQGYYAPSNWTTSQTNANPNGFVTTVNAPASIVLVSGSNGNANGDDGYLDYSKTIGCAGNVTFNWSYSTPDLAFADAPFYSINGGTPILFPGYNLAGSSTQTGTANISVPTGAILTLSAYTLDNDLAPCSITISNFVAPSAPISGTTSFWSALTGGTNIGNTSITVSPTNTTTYYAQYTDAAFGCVNPYRDSVQVLVNQLPNITASSDKDTICLGNKVRFNGGNVGIGGTYAWTNGPTDNVDYFPPAAGNVNYVVTGTDANGCSNTSSVAVMVNALPVVSGIITPNPTCKNASTVFAGAGASTYTWNNGSSTPTNNVAFFPPIAGVSTYTVIGIDANNCVSSATVSLLVDTLPTIIASASANTICFGDTTRLTGSGANTYTWTDGSNTPLDDVVYTPPTSGNITYTVTGTDGNTCSATSTINVLVHNQSTFNAPVNLISKCPGVVGGSVIVSSPNTNIFSIMPSGPSQPSLGIFTGMIGGTVYTVTLTDPNTCTNTTTITATNPANGGLSNATSSNILSVPGNSCNNQNQTDGTTLSYYGATCDNLIATVNDGSGGNTLGNVNACVTVLPVVPTYNAQPYLPRYYMITPQNQGPANITLYFTQDDFDDYNAAAGAYPQIPAVQSSGTATFCISQVPQGFLPGASGATTIVHTVTATWNATASRWEVTFPVTSFSGFYCHACNPLNSALPAAIEDFIGRKTTTTDLLTWKTTSELNNASFNILYSNNGKDFTTMGSVNSKANNGYSNQILAYSFENLKPTLGHNYYKLEQVDIDGKSMTNTKLVDLIWGTNGSTVSIYPNPTTDELNIDLFTTKAQNTSVKVLDMSGRIVKEVQTKSQAGANNIKMNLGELATGVYSIQIYENSQLTQVSKIEKN